MYGEVGHYVSTFRLARALRARGHRIVYLALSKLAPLVRCEGFACVLFASDQHGDPGDDEHRRFAEWLHRIEGGELERCLGTAAPDLLLCDSLLWPVALRAFGLGIPTINLSGNLALPANRNVPPLTTDLRPSDAWWSPFRVRSAWWRVRLQLFLDERRAGFFGGSLRSPERMHRLHGLFLRSAARVGYRCEENRTYWLTEFGPRLALPEVTFCPAALQLPGAPDVGRRHLDDVVDRERSEDPLPAELDLDKPLIYCSLGGAAALYPHATRCFRAIVAVAWARPDWQLVLHVGHWEGSTLPPTPANLLVRQSVPQLTLLRRATLMVTHGGMNSITECIHFGVPMVVIPGLRDQPGNAVRAVYHGIAVSARMAEITGDRLVTLIERARADDDLRQGLARMQRAIEAGNGVAEIIGFLEDAARRAPTSGNGLGDFGDPNREP